MKETKYVIELTNNEFKYLILMVLNNLSLASLELNNNQSTVRLDRQSSEQLREHLTERLAKYGFDEKYSPNDEGKMLESLIDKFYINSELHKPTMAPGLPKKE